jgi:hypothetical protein
MDLESPRLFFGHKSAPVHASGRRRLQKRAGARRARATERSVIIAQYSGRAWSLRLHTLKNFYSPQDVELL